MKNLVFVPLPYGTGNDLSKSLGWGNREGGWGKNLETLVKALANSQKDQFTYWDVQMQAR
jgi:diacylglycerol kinase family enzyme